MAFLDNSGVTALVTRLKNYFALKTDKQDTLVSGTNIKTINGESILGSGDMSLHFIAPTGAAWTTIGNTWSPNRSGIGVLYMSPSNSSNAYVRIVDQTNNNATVVHISSTSGLGVSTSFPVIIGHTYSVSLKSSNISTFSVSLYTWDFV